MAEPGRLRVGLSAVLVAVASDQPLVLVRSGKASDPPALPFGAFDPTGHRTFELGLRGWVASQTGFDLGYVEQLYTFGDQGRDLPEARLNDGTLADRVISVGYLALTREAAPPAAHFSAAWRSWYDLFPWEDHRSGWPELIESRIRPALTGWAKGADDRLSRIATAFPDRSEGWADERVLERYELMYEAGLVSERARDNATAADCAPPADPGQPLASDHRRILATAISRLRGKLRYRPVIFELIPDAFTLSDLQRACEAVLGQNLHKQNFRRALEKTGLVSPTGGYSTATGGRPAALYRFEPDSEAARLRLGLSTPILRTETVG